MGNREDEPNSWTNVCGHEFWWQLRAMQQGRCLATGGVYVVGDLVPNKQLTMDYKTMDSDYK